MGFIEETQNPDVGLERRGESLRVYAPKGHLFGVYEGETDMVEISYTFLRMLFAELPRHPEIMRRVDAARRADTEGSDHD